ncbi:MAG: LptF/LptG family permease [Deltaproteobacteria bacterium]|nr:LptF/LptG family permease [Deltaproteobacteria bacterium]
MSQPFILYRYIAREIIGYSFIALLMITVVLVAGDVGSELVPLIAKGVSLGDVVHLALLTLPMVLSYSIPMAFVFGLLAAYGRLSGDLEIAAMRASGLHIGHLLLPALVIGLVLSLAIGKFSLDLEAPARAQARLTLRAIAVSKPVITPGQFHTFRAHVLMVDRKDKDGTLRGVFISDFSDRNKPFEVFAETGKLSSDQDLAQIKLDLSDGAIHLFNKEITNEDRRISFEHMQYAFRFGDAEDVPQGLPWRPHDASTEALRVRHGCVAAVVPLALCAFGAAPTPPFQFLRRLDLPGHHFLLLHDIRFRGVLGRKTSPGSLAVDLVGQRLACLGFHSFTGARKSQRGLGWG